MKQGRDRVGGLRASTLAALLLSTHGWQPHAFRHSLSARSTVVSSAQWFGALRAAPANEECDFDEDGIFQCLADQGFVENTELGIERLFVAQLESLSSMHPSWDDESSEESTSSNGNASSSSNVIKYHKRQPRRTNGSNGSSNSHSMANQAYHRFVEDSEVVLVDTVRRPGMQSASRAFISAGPRAHLHFCPSEVNAAIVTCGGLCPGLNNVIRELTHALYYLYGCNQVWGVRGGFHGFLPDKEGYEPVLLTNEWVEQIHHEGGTVLRSSRGGFDVEAILEFLQKRQISQLYVIGGDGTHRAAYAIHQACQIRRLNIAVAGIPKTIDNDVDYIDRSFGFVSAVEAAQNSIRTAKTEAMCNVPNGIGIVKLMGRSAGFLAAFSALGSGDVDAVLVPEVPIVLEGADGLLPFIRQRAKEQKYVVIVVAEGAGEELLGASTETDAGGNKKLPAIGYYVKEQIEDYFARHDEEVTAKYIDPSYTVRSVPANAADSLYCLQLAQNAVHGAMAGYTGFSVGLVNHRIVYLPIPLLVATSPRNLRPDGQIWERVLAMTGQPMPEMATAAAEEGVLAVEEEEFPRLPEPTLH